MMPWRVETWPGLSSEAQILYSGRMTKLLDIAVAKVRALPKEEQDAAAETLLALAELAEAGGHYALSAEEGRAVDEGLEQAKRGEYASEADVARTWKKFDQ